MATWSPPEHRLNKGRKELTFHDKVLKDIPIAASQAWHSETHHETDVEVRGRTLTYNKPLTRYIATRHASEFGRPIRFSSCKTSLDTKKPVSFKFTLPKQPRSKDADADADSITQHPSVAQRRVIEHSVQASPQTHSEAAQTIHYGLVNAGLQYTAQGSAAEPRADGQTSLAALTEFLQKPEIAIAIEEALQQNETIDVFARDFDNLGVDDGRAAQLDASLGSGTETGIAEIRNFHDVTYTRNKRAECINWVPGEPDVVAVSYLHNLTFGQKVQNAGKPRPSCILLWSFHDSLSPHAALHSPNEVSTFSFCPTDRRFVIGGLVTGQLALWRLTDQELGITSAKRGKVPRKKKDKETKKEKEKSVAKSRTVLQINHKLLSTIDESHKRACTSIAWLPHWVDVVRKGSCVDKRGNADTEDENEDSSEKVKFFVTIAGDGQILLWDFQSARDAVVRGEHDFVWKPIHRVQLQRQDSGTEMGCTHILPILSMNLSCQPREGHDGASLSSFFATTEEGELIYGDWAPRTSGDKKPDFVKSLCEANKTFRPLLQLASSNTIADLFLMVSDWEFSLWYIGPSEPSASRPHDAAVTDDMDGSERPAEFMQPTLSEAIFRSSSPNSYYSCGSFSPTRPGVIYLGKADGAMDVWDFTDQSHKPMMSHTITAVALTTMTFSPEGQPLLAVGDEYGHLHILELPSSLTDGPEREEEVSSYNTSGITSLLTLMVDASLQILREILDRQYMRLELATKRKASLRGSKPQQETGAVEKADVASPSEDQSIDEDYTKMLTEFCESANISLADLENGIMQP
ncbi:WD repeat domain 63 [Perkinsus chesapeaki]|uniref:WD repeat domain 63 n=1 Tax=Perkinsus chesapeaki TaxID=330153 RepID=A0A7J6LA68_PERCH|nr:WD repeat domain 63 [Perkinsus chesapeaki]